MIRAVWSSIAGYALAPLQDFLSLGTEARMNYPGRASGNWTWRFPAFALDEMLKARIKESQFPLLAPAGTHETAQDRQESGRRKPESEIPASPGPMIIIYTRFPGRYPIPTKIITPPMISSPLGISLNTSTASSEVPIGSASTATETKAAGR